MKNKNNKKKYKKNKKMEAPSNENKHQFVKTIDLESKQNAKMNRSKQ